MMPEEKAALEAVQWNSSPVNNPKTCVHEQGAPNTRAEPLYGPLGHFMLFMGVTPRPKSVRFVCNLCGQTFEETDDPEVCKKHMAT